MAAKVKAVMESLDGARHSLLTLADDEDFDTYEYDPNQRIDEASADAVAALRDQSGAENFNFALTALGTTTLRALQATVIRDILEGHDGIVTAPTGCGKSGMFQIPAIALHRKDRRTFFLVISPLIMLIEDQCVALNDKAQGTGIDYLLARSSMPRDDENDPDEDDVFDEASLARLRVMLGGDVGWTGVQPEGTDEGPRRGDD